MLDLERSLVRLLGRRDRYSIGLFGLGRSNAALLSSLSRLESVSITVRDERTDLTVPDTERAVIVRHGKDALCGITEDVIFLSPSVRRDRRELSDAAARGTLLTSDCELFFADGPSVLGITGSDGKSTTTALTAALLRNGGYRAEAVGNIGVPYATVPKSDVYAAELSSFNLSYVAPVLEAAAITNITPNHLNWHKSYDEYRAAKLNVLTRAKRTVLSADDPEGLALLMRRGADCAVSVRVPFSRLSRQAEARDFFTHERGYICKNGVPLSDTSTYLRREEHTLSNMLTAAALTDGWVAADTLHRTFADFSGLPHRCEHVLTAFGVSFYNSSIDTSPARCARTLASLDRPVKLLLGGRGKGLSYEPLTEPLAKYARRIAVYGDEADNITDFLSSTPSLRDIPARAGSDFDSALDYLLSDLGHGDTVLLSPAATAYGEFRDFEERGEHFKNRVMTYVNASKI